MTDSSAVVAVRRAVVRVAGEVSRELHGGGGGGGAAAVPGRLDGGASLERDLGLDSLGRAELLARLERELAVALPDRVLATAETLDDLVRELVEAGAGAAAVDLAEAAAGVPGQVVAGGMAGAAGESAGQGDAARGGGGTAAGGKGQGAVHATAANAAGAAAGAAGAAADAVGAAAGAAGAAADAAGAAAGAAGAAAHAAGAAGAAADVAGAAAGAAGAAADVAGAAADEAGAAADAAGAEAAPGTTRTLVEVLEWHAGRHAGRRHVAFYDEDGELRGLTYGELLRRSRRVAAALGAAGIGRGRTVALMLPSGHDYFVAFCGAMLAGAAPVPLYPPARRSQLEDHLRRQAGILAVSQAAALISFPEAMTAARLLRAQVPGLARVTTVAELEGDAGGGGADGGRSAGTAGTAGAAGAAGAVAAAGAGHGPEADAGGAAGAGGGLEADAGAADSADSPDPGEEIAFLQFTSGSTGRPKGVVLTHANLLANLRAIGQAVEMGPRDVVVSWLPLYHDMGLIGAWMASLYFGLPLVLMSPLAFLARPARWLQAVSRHRGTLSAAPNFAYELCARKVSAEEMAGVDLSSWRWALNGAEPVSPEALRRFGARFLPYGFRAAAMAPVYGLAEGALALCFPPPGRGPVIDAVERRQFERSGRAAPVGGDGNGGGGAASGDRAGRATGAADGGVGADAGGGPAAVLRFVGCGVPLVGHEVRIVDAAGNEVGERREGRLHFRGPSATRGYFRDAEATRRLRHGEWLDSGDRAYRVGREVFITGRDKDIVIRGGRNLYPHELEDAVGEVPGLRKGCVAVFGVADGAAGTERLVVLAETRERGAAGLAALRAAVQERAVALLGEPVDEVVLVGPHSVPKTSSGKVRRAASRELYVAGRLGRGGAGVGWQLARLAVSGARAQAAGALRAAGALLYSAYVWSVFAAIGVPLWLAVAVLPGERRRRALASGAARLMMRCAGLRFRVSGLAELAAALPSPARPVGCFVAVNHASYLDAVALTAMLPPAVGFVAKRELADSFLSRVMMRRLGGLLVERFDRKESAAEVPRAAAALAAGEALAIFPEGTFKREPGLRPFRMGAFLAAAQTGAPVVPAILDGTRHVLRDEGAIFRRGAVALTVLPPCRPDGDDWAAALRLRDRVRAAMLAALPAAERSPAAGLGEVDGRLEGSPG